MLVLCLVYLSVSFSEKIRAVKTKQPLFRPSVIACITCWQKMRGFTIEVNGNLIALSGFVVGPPLTAYQLLLLWSGSLLNEDTFCNIASCCVERVSLSIYCHYDYELLYYNCLLLVWAVDEHMEALRGSKSLFCLSWVPAGLRDSQTTGWFQLM